VKNQIIESNLGFIVTSSTTIHRVDLKELSSLSPVVEALIMSSAVAELEAGLQAMVQLRPPGVSGSRIAGLTTLCTQNIQVCR
jgi:hypothetical protein